MHFEAGYVPAHHDAAAFAQALRAVGEPVFGRKASEVSMSRLLAQLFEITALFDMRLRPELVLLQKTMVTVEGVARRIDPSHDIWVAAEPIVARWIARELSPATRARELIRDARTAVGALARLAEAELAPRAASPAAEPETGAGVAAERERSVWFLAVAWFLAGAALSAFGFAIGMAIERGVLR